MKPRYRQRVQIESRAVFSIGFLTGQGRVLDLTIPGCLMESSLPVKGGDSMQLKLFLSGSKVPLCVSEGVVRWVNGTRCGVEFVKMREQDRQQLNQFVAGHPFCLTPKPRGEGQKWGESDGHNWHLDIHSL